MSIHLDTVTMAVSVTAEWRVSILRTMYIIYIHNINVQNGKFLF